MKTILYALILSSVLICLNSMPLAAQDEGGAMVPCLASCCLDPRLGYEMNEGKEIHMYDVLSLFGILRLIPAVDWGLARSGAGGFCVTLFWGNRAGRDFKTTRLRGKELLLCVPVVNIVSAVLILSEVLGGKTWSEVEQAENLKR